MASGKALSAGLSVSLVKLLGTASRHTKFCHKTLLFPFVLHSQMRTTPVFAISEDLVVSKLHPHFFFLFFFSSLT